MSDVSSSIPADFVFLDSEVYYPNIDDHFLFLPELARPLLKNAKVVLLKIEEMLYSAPAFLNVVKSSIPKESLHAVLSEDQKSKLAEGVIKLMTKKDGSLMANLVDVETKKIVSTISLEHIKCTPEVTQAMTNFATQMQMTQIAEQIRLVQIAVEEVRQGQEFDRLATAYSCQQKLIQAMTIKNPELKTLALLRIASDAEDSRNLLMQSQMANVTFIKNQPESFFGKLITGAAPVKLNSRMNEIRESLCAINMVSFAEAMAYFEMGESEASRISLGYYAEYIQKTYLETEGLMERLDLIDPSPYNYWTKTIPEISKKINKLPYYEQEKLLGESNYGN